jgi:hypothetical protein
LLGCWCDRLRGASWPLYLSKVSRWRVRIGQFRGFRHSRSAADQETVLSIQIAVGARLATGRHVAADLSRPTGEAGLHCPLAMPGSSEAWFIQRIHGTEEENDDDDDDDRKCLIPLGRGGSGGEEQTIPTYVLASIPWQSTPSSLNNCGEEKTKNAGPAAGTRTATVWVFPATSCRPRISEHSEC